MPMPDSQESSCFQLSMNTTSETFNTWFTYSKMYILKIITKAYKIQRMICLYPQIFTKWGAAAVIILTEDLT